MSLLYESPGVNQVDGLPPVPNTGAVSIQPTFGPRRSMSFATLKAFASDHRLSVTRSVQ